MGQGEALGAAPVLQGGGGDAVAAGGGGDGGGGGRGRGDGGVVQVRRLHGAAYWVTIVVVHIASLLGCYRVLPGC